MLEASMGLTWGIVTGEAVCSHILPKWLTGKHMMVSSNLLPESRVPLFPSHIHSTNKCQALIDQTQYWALIPSQICVSDPSICLCLLQASALSTPYSSQPSLSASPSPYTSPLGPASPEKPTPPPHSCLSAPSPASEEHVWTRVPSEVRGEKKKGS